MQSSCCWGPTYHAVNKIHCRGDKTSPESSAIHAILVLFLCNRAFHSFALCIHGRGLNPPPLHSSRLLAPHWCWGGEAAEQRNSKSFSFSWVIQLLFLWWTEFLNARGVISSAAACVALSAYILCHRARKESITRVNSGIASESFSSLFGESEAGESPSLCPQALFTGNILQRCQEKPQAILEDRLETSFRIHQWAEGDSRAWFTPFWKLNELTPWIMCCCEIGYTCPRVLNLFKNLCKFYFCNCFLSHHILFTEMTQLRSQ